MVPVASVWRRAWMGSTGGGGHGTDSTSDTTYTASATTATSDSAGEPRLHDLHPFTALPTAPVVEGNYAEEVDQDVEEFEEDMAIKKLDHIEGLVVEFRGDSRRALTRWLSELNVGWVLHLARTPECSWSNVPWHSFKFHRETWILALRKIGESILTSLDGWCSQRQDQDEGSSKQPSASEFAQLVHASVLKMLPFVDIAAAATTSDRPRAVAVESVEKLQVLIDMRDALSIVSQHILSLQGESTDIAMGNHLSADLTKLDEAIWIAMVEIMNNIMAWTWTHDGCSNDIHNVSNSIVSYTKVLWANYALVNRILHDAVLRGEFVSQNENVSHATNLIIEMVSSLEKKPSAKSSRESFPDESLRFLFLINNSYFLLQKFHRLLHLDFITVSLTHKINDYISSYLHVSWAPVLKCLQDPAAPRCFTRYSSPLPKFESKFQKIYAAQKLWKVPDPCMRKRLRKAVVDNVVPVFTQFLEDNNISTPGIPPRKVEKMLGKLFEG